MAYDELETLRLVGASQIHAATTNRAHVFKYTGSSSKIFQFGHRKRNVPQAQPRAVKTDSYQTIGIVVGQRAQQHGVHDAKDGCIASHPQRERQDGYQSESRLLAQHAETVANILK